MKTVALKPAISIQRIVLARTIQMITVKMQTTRTQKMTPVMKAVSELKQLKIARVRRPAPTMGQQLL